MKIKNPVLQPLLKLKYSIENTFILMLQGFFVA